MGGKVWSAEEEKFFWEVIVPQAPAGLDAASKQAKKDVHMAWAPLSRQMEREMARRLKPEERPRRKYTPIGCYEHYFQNYINRHYSPHAKALVFKYKASLKTATSSANPQPAADDDKSSQINPEPVPDPPRVNSQITPSFEASDHMSQVTGAAAPMSITEASLDPVQDQDGPSAMQVLCDAALAVAEGDSSSTKESDKEDEDFAARSRRHGKKRAAVASEDSDDMKGLSSQDGSGSVEPAQRQMRKTQREQRHNRKVAHRQAQASDVMTRTEAPPPALLQPGSFPNVPPGYFNGPMMYDQQSAYFGHRYDMWPSSPPLQNSNAFQSNHTVRLNGFHTYGGPPSFGGYPQFEGVARFDGFPHTGVGGPLPQHAVPYMGGYHNPGYINNNGGDYGNASASSGGYESMRGKGDGKGDPSGHDEEESDDNNSNGNKGTERSLAIEDGSK